VTSLPDSVPPNALLRRLPAAWTPYVQLARIDRPIGWQLLLLPCWWSDALAAAAQHRAPYWSHLVLFMIGAISMRGAGSAWNDLIDRDIDKHVERTKHRPLASGRVTPRQATIFLLCLALVGGIVLLTFNWFAVGVGMASLLVVAAYPFAKRFTFWPQAVLGLAFAWGGLMGWACAMGALAPPAFYIYACAIFWTIGYDTIYALQDARDDAIVGVRSTARLFGENVKAGVGAFYAAAVAAGALALWSVDARIASWLGLAGFAAHLAWQVFSIRRDDVGNALRLFRANRDAGIILFAGLALDGALAAYLHS
jgi:4-hydroxybenzoate polyprenyltransferase